MTTWRARYILGTIIVACAIPRFAAAQLSALPAMTVTLGASASAYDPRHQAFLLVGAPENTTVFGMFVGPQGHQVVAPFGIGAGTISVSPQVTYSSDLAAGAGGFLVVWSDQGAGNVQSVHARVVAYPGTLIGNESVVGDPTTGFASVGTLAAAAYSTTSQVFLVAVTTQAGGMVVRRVGLDAQPIGSAIALGPIGQSIVVWNAATNEFALCGESQTFDSHGQGTDAVSTVRLAPTGTVLRQTAVATFGTGVESSGACTLAVNASTGNYLVLWWAQSTQLLTPGAVTGLFAAEVDTSGSVISSGTIGQVDGFIVQVSYGPFSGTFVVTWGALINSGTGSAFSGIPGTGRAFELNTHGERLSPLLTLATTGSIASRSDGPSWLLAGGGSVVPLSTTSTGGGAAGTPLTAGCSSSDPFASVGGGVCRYGGWVPRGLIPPPLTNPGSASPGASDGSCTSSDPFVSIGGGVCHNGGWVPASSTSSTSSTPPAPPPVTGCSTPDPFESLQTLIGHCANGGWIPVPGVKTTGTIEETAGVWRILGSDGKFYEPDSALAPALQMVGLAVSFEAELLSGIAPAIAGDIEVDIHTITAASVAAIDHIAS